MNFLKSRKPHLRRLSQAELSLRSFLSRVSSKKSNRCKSSDWLPLRNHLHTSWGKRVALWNPNLNRRVSWISHRPVAFSFSRVPQGMEQERYWKYLDVCQLNPSMLSNLIETKQRIRMKEGSELSGAKMKKKVRMKQRRKRN